MNEKLLPTYLTKNKISFQKLGTLLAVAFQPLPGYELPSPFVPCASPIPK